MRTINFDDEDIKQCKLALTNQNLTPLQSAFLMQYITNIEQENKQLKERIEYLERSNNRREDTILEQRQEISDLEDNWNKLKHKLSKIETLVINHNCDTGDIYYKYNSKFLKSELKQRILEIVYEQGSDE